jgi:hypothetical protein
VWGFKFVGSVIITITKQFVFLAEVLKIEWALKKIVNWDDA